MVALESTLVSTDWLQHNLGSTGLSIIDTRGYVKSRDLGGGRQSAEYLPATDEYLAGHIPGSVFVDWTLDITDPDDEVKAQLAKPDRFKAAMEARGIGDDSAVVVVDHSGGHFATRMWWALRYYGHIGVAVLDGGFNKWARENRPLTAVVPTPTIASFTAQPNPSLRADWQTVNAAIEDERSLIVDARDAETFSGRTWRGARPGHIASAINLPASSLFTPDGTWKSDAELAEIVKSAGLTNDKKALVYCNGGVTATSVLFAMDRLGMGNGVNYDGSWNEWSERSDLPVETGD